MISLGCGEVSRRAAAAPANATKTAWAQVLPVKLPAQLGEPRREECTICTGVTHEAVFTVWIYGTGPS
jgi:hypothetical protein